MSPAPPTCSGGRSANWTARAGCLPRPTPRCRSLMTGLRVWPGYGRPPPCCASTVATGTSPRWWRPASTAASPLVLRCGIDLRREDLQPLRGWTDEEWDDARSRLADRGWMGADGELTVAGREAHAAVEDATDRAAARPWARLGPEASAELAEVLTPIARACASVLPYPSPVGVPAPGTVG